MISVSIAASSEIIWRPFFSSATIGALVAMGLAAAAYAYWRVRQRRPLTSVILLGWRMASVLAIALVLAGPSRMPDVRHTTGKFDLQVLVDLSASMATDDCQGSSRIELVKQLWLRPKNVAALEEVCTVRWWGFAEQIVPLDVRNRDRIAVNADGRATRLAASVAARLTGASTAAAGASQAILVISDGRDTESPSIDAVTRLARARRMPIHTVAVGTEVTRPDLSLTAVPLQDYLIVGEPGQIAVRLYQSGLGQGSATLRIRQGNDEQIVPISLAGKGTMDLKIDIQSDVAGQQQWDLSLDANELEVETGNNRQTVFSDVRDRPIRVLVLEGDPFWDTKFLTQSLRKDDHVQVSQITQVADHRRETLVSGPRRETVEVPEDVDQWAHYDVVVLGRHLQRLLDVPAANALRQYVTERGGRLVFARGKAVDEQEGDGQKIARVLGQLEPVVWGDVHPAAAVAPAELTPFGHDGAWLAGDRLRLPLERVLAELPPLKVAREVRRLRPATLLIAVAGGNEHPLITTMHAEQGRVIMIAANGTWRWGLLGPEDRQLAQFYDRFWSSMMRWLVLGSDFPPGEEVALRLDRQTLQRGDEVVAEVTIRNREIDAARWNLVWLHPDGHAETLAPRPVPATVGRYRVRLKVDQTGTHQLTFVSPHAASTNVERRFEVFDVNLEQLNVAANPDLLRRLAEGSGGNVFASDEPAGCVDSIVRARTASMVPREPVYIWNRLVVLIALLVWVSVEWFLRRAAGLW